MALQIIQKPSKFWNERPQGAAIKAVVLHCSAYTPPAMLKVLNEKQLSAHYIIGASGKIWQLVPEEKRAWHARAGSWREMENLNHYSIGIELSSPSMGQEPYRQAQIKALLELLQDITARHKIPAANIIAHSDMAPTRKPDPGLAFAWQTLAAAGFGLWYNLNDASKIGTADIDTLLRQIGYDTTDSAAAQYAFCRHFLPELVEKIADKDELIEHVYPPHFALPPQYLPHLQAVAYAYSITD